MEIKKHSSADVHKKAGLFFQIGLLVALALTVCAFEWRNYDTGNFVDLGQVQDDFEDLLEIPPTEQPPPPPPKIQQPEIIEVPDEEEIEEEIEIDLDVEITEEKVIEDIIIEEAPEEEVAEEIFQIVEEPATPKGGYAAFYEYVAKNLRYPPQARRMGIEGKVFVQFVVDRDGKVKDIQIARGIGAGCDEEAVRILQNAPDWNPPRQRGVPVSQRIMIRIAFQLN
ncbi:Ferric siderophore transport system, periplasmic binding protein TonB [Fulvivirga imtechensis AK7]|uniref:Ferric siderophore transport system, periplasmic binding protein TonB n=1 Tax=Fulvivirga imtechensis AK7 TaxID=1237149 RepID=L8JNG2_9BACT|nr:energy transducer TonB [Fulvivirga imtechensis]ELR69723.1 Ferric siderophore transport system, periplasmic binding protein TonB [Fulvivirga imtechensis AK7]